MKDAIAVGHGRRNDGTYDSGAVSGAKTEQNQGDIAAKSCADTLRSWGEDVRDEAYQDDPNYQGTDNWVRAWGADILVEIHHDWIGAATGAFALWYKPQGHALGNAIEAAIGKAGFEIRNYPADGYRGDLTLLKTVGDIPAVLVELGRIGQYSTDELKRLGVAVAHGIADYAGITKEDEMTVDEIRTIVRAVVREEIDVVSAPEVVDRAQQKLIAANILSSPHPSSKAASVGLVEIMLWRALDQMGIDLSEYNIQLTKKA